jgi:1,4-dihydroxy-6-naphthoate synthase
MKYTLAFSPCPNDTFMMHGIMAGKVRSAGIEFDISLLDIQELNSAMVNERFDFSKVSSIAAVRNLSMYELCPTGAALGYGVGPLLLRRPGALALGEDSVVLCPGATTTACALFREFYPDAVGGIQHCLFSEIMPALEREEADYGVVIHEGRFTYKARGLELVADLGNLWEERFSLPLPLGCFVAHTRVGAAAQREVSELVRRSIEYGYSHREEVYETMKRHAQELDEQAIWSHVDLYVNEWSLALGQTGSAAFGQLRKLCNIPADPA